MTRTRRSFTDEFKREAVTCPHTPKSRVPPLKSGYFPALAAELQPL